MLRELGQSERLKEVLATSGRLVVIGAGWIGLEVAAAATDAAVEVTVVEAAPQPLLRVLGWQLAEAVARLHREHGVELRLGAGVAEIRGDAVLTTAGEVLPADAILVGVGVAPLTSLAETGGLAVDDGVVTDAALRTSHPDVFAAGDLANAFHPRYGRHIRSEHWANALNGGPAAARSMLGQDVIYDRLPYFYTDQYDFGMEYVGWADAATAQVVVRGDLTWPSRRSGSSTASSRRPCTPTSGTRGGPLKAVVNLRRPVDTDRLADPGVPLSDL